MVQRHPPHLCSLAQEQAGTEGVLNQLGLVQAGQGQGLCVNAPLGDKLLPSGLKAPLGGGEKGGAGVLETEPYLAGAPTLSSSTLKPSTAL